MAQTHYVMILLTVTAILVTTLGQPIQEFRQSTKFDNKHGTEEDPAAYSLAAKIQTFYEALSNIFSQSQSRDKRDVTAQYTELSVNSTTNNETSFEYYEKQYFINKTLAILEQYVSNSYDNEHVKGNNSSTSGSGVNTSSGYPATEPARPSALPHAGGQTTDKGRTDPILEAKLRELNKLDLDQLMYVFQNVEEKQKDNIEDPSIASLCCRYG